MNNEDSGRAELEFGNRCGLDFGSDESRSEAFRQVKVCIFVKYRIVIESLGG